MGSSLAGSGSLFRHEWLREGHAARAMEIDAVEMIASLVIGAPLCRAHSRNKKINGLEVNFKGGQVGAEDYFVLVKDGKSKKSKVKNSEPFDF